MSPILEKALIVLFSLVGIGGLGYSLFTWIRPKNVWESLRVGGYGPLDVEGETDKEKFLKIVKKHQSDKTDIQECMTGLDLTNKTQDDDKFNEIKKQCKEVFKVSIDDPNFANKVTLGRIWCSEDSPHLVESAQ